MQKIMIDRGYHIRITRKRKKGLSKDTFLGYDRKSMGAETVGDFYRLLLKKIPQR